MKPGWKRMRGRRAGMAFILITLFLDVLGIGIVIPVLPGLVTSFLGGDASAAAPWYALLAGGYAAMQFVFAPLLGALSDRFGRRPVILASLAGFGVSYLALAAAPTLAWLFVARLAAGVAGATLTAGNAYVADVSDERTRARNYGLVGVAFGLGFVAGPALGGVLGEIGLRVPFLVSAGIVGLNFVYGLLVLPESLPEERRTTFSWRRADPLRSLVALREFPLAAGLAASLTLLMLGQRGMESVFVLYTDWRYGWGPGQNGVALALVGVMAVIVQGGLIRPVVARWGERRTATVGMTILACGLVAYGLADRGAWLLIAIVVGGLGALAQPALQSLVAGSVPPERQGAVQGAITSLLSASAVLAPLVAGGLFGAFTGDGAPLQLPGAPFFAAAAFVLVGLILALRTFRRLPANAASRRESLE
ncbi:MAG: TCR/Tet family MFS transporter [Trueperaceae bacterium]